MRGLGRFMIMAVRIGVSLPSYCFVYITRRILRKINRKGGFMLGKQSSLSWQGWSQTQAYRWALPYVMIVAPRWNPHSVQHHLGPFQVNSIISVNVETVRKSAKQWIISFFKNGKEFYTLTSRECANDGPWHSISLKPGTYEIFIRYFDWDINGECPAVDIDHQLQIASCPIEPEIASYENFMINLKHHRNFFYWFLHCYVYTSLKWHKRLPAKFVRKAYLPLGNPGTIFYYGLLDKGGILQINYPESLSGKANIYLVVLDTYGFPIFWRTLSKNQFISDEVPRNGTYLIRIIYKKLSDFNAAAQKEEFCNLHMKEGKFHILNLRDSADISA